MNARTLTDTQISALDVGQINSGLIHPRADLRYSRADAERAVELWNACKVSTRGILITAAGRPQIIVVDRHD